jgi:hypothetical protein
MVTDAYVEYSMGEIRTQITPPLFQRRLHDNPETEVPW